MGQIDPRMRSLWQRSEPVIAERVAALEAAAATLRHGQLDEETRAQRWLEAQMLAGSLGSFGLPRGSEIAAGIEALLAPGRALTDADRDALDRGVAELRNCFEQAR